MTELVEEKLDAEFAARKEFFKIKDKSTIWQRLRFFWRHTILRKPVRYGWKWYGGYGVYSTGSIKSEDVIE